MLQRVFATAEASCLYVRHTAVLCQNDATQDHHILTVDSLESLVSNEVILVPLGEEIPLERGHQRGVPPLEIVILPLFAHL